MITRGGQMACKKDCYIVNKSYKLDKERVKKAFEILLNIKIKDNKEEKI